MFGFIAWSMLSTSSIFSNMNYTQVIIPLLSAITSVAALQTFAFQLGDSNIIDISGIFKNFKTKIVEQSTKKDQEKDQEIKTIKADEKAIFYYKMIKALSEKIPLETLCSNCIYVLQEVYAREEPKISEPLSKANEYVEKLKADSPNQKLLTELLASEIVSNNPNYGKIILDSAGVKYG
ncbi:MAG: hypothetical protein WCE94_10905 [Candidatus Methanoperedens sp.]